LTDLPKRFVKFTYNATTTLREFTNYALCTVADGSNAADADAISEFYKWEGADFRPPVQMPPEEDLDTGGSPG